MLTFSFFIMNTNRGIKLSKLPTMETSTKTRAQIINHFLDHHQLTPRDLARYLELNHDFACLKDEQFDDTEA